MSTLKKSWKLFAIVMGICAIYISYHYYQEDEYLKATVTLILALIWIIDNGRKLLLAKQNSRNNSGQSND
jgi:CHASE3 domain sensor protein